MEGPRHPFYTAFFFRAGLALAFIMPPRLARWFSWLIVFLGYPLATKARAAARMNLGRVTGQRGAGLEALCRQNLFNFGSTLADYFCGSRATPEDIGRLFENWHGLPKIQAARAAGKGVILVTVHLGNWELGAIQLAAMGEPVTVVTREEPSVELARWRENTRRRLGIKTVTIGSGNFAFVDVMNALKRNELIALLADRPEGETGVPVTFFGAPTKFSPAPVLLWKQTGAAVMPVFVYRAPSGKYVGHAESPIEMSDYPERADLLIQNTQRIAAVCERIIRAHPEQWFNYAEMWESAPPG